MDTAKRMVELARELYGTSLTNLTHAQQAVVAQLVAAEIQSFSMKELKEVLIYKPLT